MVDDSALPPPPPPPSSIPPPPPPPPPPPGSVQDAVPGGPATGPSPYARPAVPAEDHGVPRPSSGGLVRLVLGLVVTLALVAGLARAWPADEAPTPVDPDAPPSTLMSAEIAESLPPGGTGAASDLGELGGPLPADGPAADLFTTGAAAAVAELLQASGDPDQLIELTIYPEYLFVAYRAPGTAEIDSRQWRNEVGAATPNPIDDRVDESTTPKLFTLDELDLALDRLPSLVQDAPTHYDLPVEVTHVIIDRFLPFDERVLVRVYTSPTDGRSGGGYVTYTTAGAFQKACC